MDEGFYALGLMFVGLLLILGAMVYYIIQMTARAPVNGGVCYSVGIAGTALFFAGGAIWRRGIPRDKR
jgi:hypothetical protein